MKDQDRLELLKEVAGTTVYEERRGESTKILQETAHKQERIAEILTFIEERLEELEQEKDELKEYDNLDKRRRALEYHMYDKDLARAQAQLAEMEDSQDEQRARQHELYATLRTAAGTHRATLRITLRNKKTNALGQLIKMSINPAQPDGEEPAPEKAEQ